MPIKTCNVVGSLVDVQGLPIGGTLQVEAAAVFWDDSTTPDSIISKAPKTFVIPSTGVINIALPVTAPKKVAYKFKLTPSTGTVIEFEEVIPDQTSVEFSSLLPTNFVSDRAATGAIKIAKEMLTNASIQPYIISGLGIIRQSTKPGTPVRTDISWLNTANGLIYSWDSTENNWLGPVRSMTVGEPETLATINRISPVVISEGNRIKVDSVRLNWVALADPNDASNKWGLQAIRRPFNSASQIPLGSAISSNSSGFATGVFATQQFVVNSILTLPELNYFGFVATKTGSPGTFGCQTTMNFRVYAP